MTRREAYALLFEPRYGWLDQATLDAEFAVYEKLLERNGEVPASDLAQRLGNELVPPIDDVIEWLGGFYEDAQNAQVILHLAPNHRGVQAAYFQVSNDCVLASAPFWIGVGENRVPIETTARLLLSTLCPVPSR